MRKNELRALIEDLGVQQITERPSDFTALCPLHTESRPSWGISHAKPSSPWSCFSCGASGGSVIYLVQRVLDISFAAAKKKVAEYGVVEEVEIDALESFDPYTPPPAYYFEAYPFLESFRGYPKECLRSTNLRKSKDGVVVPFFLLKDFIGYMEYFPGRARRVNPQYGFLPKQHLYLPSRRITPSSTLILVEGFTDALRILSYGYTNVAAINGTTFTKSQKEELLRLDPKEVVCMFDQDQGGRAALSSFCRRRPNVPVFVAGAYDGKDPGEMSYGGFLRAMKSRSLLLE